MNLKSKFILKSDILILQELGPSDISQTYIDWLNDVEVNKYLESRYITHNENTVRDFVIACRDSETEFLFGIFVKENMKHIGNIKLGPINNYHKRADIGLIIGDKSYWGQGFAKEAILLISQFAFNTLKLHKLTAGCYESNIGSKKAFENSGYKIEGFFEQHVMLSGSREGIWKLGFVASDFESLSR